MNHMQITSNHPMNQDVIESVKNQYHTIVVCPIKMFTIHPTGIK